MDLTGHLLYIDITQICGIGCAFCMYADKHKMGSNMELSDQAIDNLRTLINTPDVKRISISGEGEPLNNIKVFHQIIQLSDGGKAFEFITSGFFPHNELSKFYEKTNNILMSNGDTCNIRLSSDSYHIERIKHRPHGFSLQYWRDHTPKALSFSFRSIDTDRTFTRDYLLSELQRWSITGLIEHCGILEDRLIVEDYAFGIDYKNLVHPSESAPVGYLDLHGYVNAIEAKTTKRFTLGSQNTPPMQNGMDLTIKPNGEVHFYGIENIAMGNIHVDQFNWKRLEERITETPLIHHLYSRPFMDMINNLSESEVAQNLIRKTNNPYWLIKELANHDDLLAQMVAS